MPNSEFLFVFIEIKSDRVGVEIRVRKLTEKFIAVCQYVILLSSSAQNILAHRVVSVFQQCKYLLSLKRLRNCPIPTTGISERMYWSTTLESRFPCDKD